MTLIRIEFVGGPSDGTQEDLPADDWLWDVMGAVTVKVRDAAVGTYVRTRKLTRDGRLIYQWRVLAPQDSRAPYE